MTPPRNCRKTLVGASIARPCPFALQENCPGKCVAAVSGRATNGRPYTRNKAEMQFFDGLRSGQDRSLQISRQHCGGYNKVGGNKKSHHGRWWDSQNFLLTLLFVLANSIIAHNVIASRRDRILSISASIAALLNFNRCYMAVSNSNCNLCASDAINIAITFRIKNLI